MAQLKNISIKSLEATVFRYDTSAFDKKALTDAIVKYVRENGKYNLSTALWASVYILNDNGRTVKYLHFNEKTQKLHLSHYLFEWAKRKCVEIESTIKKANHNGYTL